MIVHSKDLITLIGGSRFSQRTLDCALNIAPFVVAADGGADIALSQGVVPKAVIGDFDSLSRESLDQIPDSDLHRISEQNSTDFDKCLGNLESPLIISVGFSGGQLDHQLAALNTLVRHPGQRCLLLAEDDITFLAPPSLRLDLPAGARVSLFPMGAVEGVSDGLEWPINGLNFAPDGRVGTSNKATGPIELSFTAPKMLLMLPVEMLGLAVAALLDTKQTWG